MSSKNMKKLFVLMLTVVLGFTLFIPTASAKVPDFNGGVLDEYEYEEVFFLTGYPIKFTGKATVTEKENKNQLTTTYKFTLASDAGDKLTRNVVYVSDLKNYETKGQTTSNTTVKSYTEKVTMANTNKTTYTLDDYQFSQGSVIDNRPATDYYSGNVIARKIYIKSEKVDKKTQTNKITVYMDGRNVGYKNFWGSTDTQFIDYEIETPQGTGFVTSKVSDSKSRVLEYEQHTPSLSSFVGGHAVISSSNIVSEYEYNIPYYAGTGTYYLNKENTPKIERLIVPKFRDIAKHWSKTNIEKLYSLGIFDESSNFFSPDAAMKKDLFTVGVAKAVDLRVLEAKPTNKKSTKKALFKDLDVKDPNYVYIESALNKGIVSPVNKEMFGANDSITRAQAVTIIVRSLGLEGRAPTPGYTTKFIDDNKIPKEAKDSIYVASELGLIDPDTKNRINPNEVLTRGKASQLLVRYLNFLESDLKQNYRDDMLYFN